MFAWGRGMRFLRAGPRYTSRRYRLARWAHTVELITARHEAEKAREIGYRLIKAPENIADELVEVRRAAGDLAKEIARK
jgi:hypothetical protein